MFERSPMLQPDGAAAGARAALWLCREQLHALNALTGGGLTVFGQVLDLHRGDKIAFALRASIRC